MSLVCVGDRAALSTERPLEQQDGKQHKQSLGAADGSQLRDPNARHGRNNLQLSILCPLELSIDKLMQQDKMIVICEHLNPKVN